MSIVEPPEVAGQPAGAAGRYGGLHVVVTGAAQGIGRATAELFGRGGASVVVVDRAGEVAAEVVAGLEQGGAQASLVVADVGSERGAAAAIDACVASLGHIDVLINNVGGAIRIKPFERFTGEEIEAELARSFWPTMWCCMAVIPSMLAQGHGSIVNIASNSPRGIYRAPYAAAKGGVMALTTALATEYAARGIRVNCAAPGATHVPDRPVPRGYMSDEGDNQWHEELLEFFEHQIPMKRWGTVEEQAAAIAFLASNESSFITGQILSVAGGACVP